MNNTERNTVGGRPIVQCISPSRTLLREPMLFVHFLCHLLAPPSLAVGRWVRQSYASSHFSEFCVRTFTHLAGDGWSCSLEGIFCGTQNRHAIPCSPPTLVLWSGQPSALGVVSCVCVCVCVCVCLCAYVFLALPPVCVAILRFFLSLVSGLGSPGLLFMSYFPFCLLVSLRSKDYILDRHA